MTAPGPATDGLTTAEAQARLAAHGPNALPDRDRRGLLRIVAEVLREPMLALLLVGGLVYLLLGDRAEAMILLAFACFSLVITVVQEARTERLLATLADLSSPRALVLRDGIRQRIAGRKVVPGDILILAEGDRVAADAALVQASELACDESLLTGESRSVSKTATAMVPAVPRPAGEGSEAFVYSGALVVRGTGLARVTATGPRTEIGRIGQTLSRLDSEPPRLRLQTLRMVRIFGLLAVLAASAAALLHGLLRGDWLGGALSGIALGMAFLPEEIPVVLTIFMAVGAWRISQHGVLTRRAASIESLGAATVICTDKTGTLTENRMSVARLLPVGPGTDRQMLVRAGLFASAPHPVDPMDRAFHDLARQEGFQSPPNLRLAAGFGLSRALLAVTQIWRDGAAGLAAAKGAPEHIAALCRLAPEDRDRVSALASGMAAEGLRVLAIAQAPLPDGPGLPGSPQDLDFALLGLAGLADPLRASAAPAIAAFRRAGIRVVMITGDHADTALRIARDAGIDGAAAVTGPDLDGMDDATLGETVARVSVFARILPEQKLRIVQALKARGDIVAMTGDGVNDAPSLKAAHIGIAMGARGTDVAREAASIVLLDDDFAAIVPAIRLGRRIYDNLRKAMGFIVAVHLPIAGVALAPLALGLPVIFGPVHIAFIEMIIDPVCSLVFEAEREEGDIDSRPPRDPAAPLFSRGLIGWSLLQGLAATALVGASYAWGLSQALPEGELRALTFFSLVAAIVALVFVNRTFAAGPLSALARPSRILLAVPIATLAGALAVLDVPALASLFRFGPLHGHDAAAIGGGAVLLLLLLQLLKPVARPALLC